MVNKIRNWTTVVLLCLFMLPLVSAQLIPNIWKKFIGEPTFVGTPDLIDYSYAGYKNGTEGIPEDFAYTVFNVTDYGANPDDGKSDTQAIRNTIDAAKRGGIVFFPPGQYDVLTSTDNNFDPIIIPESNIILRGSGAEGAIKGGTTIKMHKERVNNRGWEVTLFGTRWLGRGSWSTFIKGSFPKGTKYFDVEDVSGLNNAKFIQISADRLFGDDWDQHSSISEDDMPSQFLISDNGVTVKEFHEIDRIEGNRIYVKAPILTHLNPNFIVKSRKLNTDIGFEDLHIDGNMKEAYMHNVQNSRGGIQLWYTAHSWVRRCRFSNTTSAIMFENTYCSSAISNVIDGNAAHYPAVVLGSTYVFVGLLEDYTNNGMFHGVSIAGRTVGSVFWRIGGTSMRGPDGHGHQPRLTLYDNYSSVDHDRSSGTYKNLPHHLDGYVRWNNTVSSSRTYDLWTWGEVGKRVVVTQANLIGYKTLGGSLPRDAYFEGFGTRVSPDSLYEAQLQRRLGVLPAWVDAAKNEYKAFFERMPPALVKTETTDTPSVDPNGGGPKIEGPWLWVLVLDQRLDKITDLLAKASGGTVRERQIATTGVVPGDKVGDYAWTPLTISASGKNNITDMTRPIDWNGNDRVIYGFITLDSPQRQNTKMFVGSDDSVKVWLNGELVREEIVGRGASDYQGSFPVTLRGGKNALLVAVENRTGGWSGFFGFQADAEYTVPPFASVGYALPNVEISTGDTFTLDIYAEDVNDLAEWQFDIAFDPAHLEAIEVHKGYFLTSAGGTTRFKEGIINNRTGRIIGLSEVIRNGNGVSGTGLLVSVTFAAKTGGETQLTLSNFRFGADTGRIIPAGPHEISLMVQHRLIWDVNEDGQVNILDLILIAQSFGKTGSLNSLTDVNHDGIVNILDLIVVAQYLGESIAPAAPSTLAMESINGLDPAMIQAWIERARVEDDGSIAFRQGIANLQRLLALLIPEEASLLPNYPNPFNPETWIPYQLSEPAEVSLAIYAVDGKLVRRLSLGHQPAGMYQDKDRSAYWDGRNAVGEPAASGIYFYTITAGDFTATRKMLIRK